MCMTFFNAKENWDALSQINIKYASVAQVNWSNTMILDKVHSLIVHLKC
jgi:hypothetical protein